MTRTATHGYYEQCLAAEALEACYALAPPRVQRYLRAEVDFAVSLLRPGDVVLDLGCGYGRTIPQVAAATSFVVGIDTSLPSLRMARERLRGVDNCGVSCMDTTKLGFGPRSFDRVLCIQNGISAFHVDRRSLLREALRVLRPDGLAAFSSYADGFWEPRLDWFERQAAAGLIGPIDHRRTRRGLVVCTDGFTSGTVRPEEVRGLAAALRAEAESVEVDGSSSFSILKPSIDARTR
jgi:2-polyprenyl-6-hydroxyphenyl methylase/3-demethylubiquinone-9 3-methyltransferase